MKLMTLKNPSCTYRKRSVCYFSKVVARDFADFMLNLELFNHFLRSHIATLREPRGCFQQGSRVTAWGFVYSELEFPQLIY